MIKENSMVKLITALITVVYISHSAQMVSLYTDHRAMRKDDILTIMIVENSKAGSESTTSTGKSNSFGIDNVKGSGPLDFIPAFGASGGLNTGFEGGGATGRSNSFIATISARVIDVQDNGNLIIEGSKVVEINEEKEIIKVSGVVRPEDIETDNTIMSYNISDANITYSGKGVADKGRRPGLFARLFNILF